MRYDVFLCYSSKDEPEANQLYELLAGSGFTIFFDKKEVVPGQSFQPALEAGLKESAAIIVLVGPGGFGPWQEVENRAYQMISVIKDRPIIPVLLPGGEGLFYSDDIPLLLKTRSSVVFETSLADGPSFVKLTSAIPRNARIVGEVERPFLDREQKALLRSTVAYYETHSDRYIETWDHDIPLAPIYAFLSHVERLSKPPGGTARILDAGCGPGHHSRFFAKHGLKVVGIDLCSRFVDYAKSVSEGSACTFIHGDMRDLDKHFHSRNQFDGVWACASCLHLAREAMSYQLYQFAAVLRPGGILGLSLQVGMPSAIQEDGRFFERYEEDDLRNLVRAHGFRVVDEVEQVSTKSTENRKQIKKWLNLITVAPGTKDRYDIPTAGYEEDV